MATTTSDSVNYGNYQTFNAFGLKVYLPAFPEIYYGDNVVLEGIVDGKKLQKAKPVSANTFTSFGSSTQEKVIGFYRKTLPQPMSGLVAGIVLGSKGALLTNDF